TTMASLPADNLASIHVDVAAVAAAAGAAEEEIPGLSSFAAALIAEERGMRLAGRLPLERDALDAAAAALLDEAGGEPTLAGWMPADTKLEIVTFGVADAIRAAEADESEASSVVAQLRAGLGLGLGLDLDEDVLPLLDGEVGIAVSQLELSGAVPPVGQVLLKPADRAVVEGTLGRIRDALEGRGAAVTTREAGGTTVTTVEVPQAGAASYAVVDGVVVIGLAPEHVLAALEARSAGETLGETEAYATAFGLLERHAGPELFLDLQGLLGVAGQFGFDAGQLDALPADARAILERVEALALATPTSADAVEIHAVLTVR
ncbi:MAG TPA: DUF3352 domain-containing protein, partial [Candidatus Limnocylindria bacterium]|nr:DUF3352 domain-containing protein [Candidatus Limnocylindria bacterium]